MVCYEVATRKRPFAGLALYKMMTMVVNGSRPNIPGDCPAEVATLMRRCWAHDPSDRPVSFEHEAGQLSQILQGYGGDPRQRSPDTGSTSIAYPAANRELRAVEVDPVLGKSHR